MTDVTDRKPRWRILRWAAAILSALAGLVLLLAALGAAFEAVAASGDAERYPPPGRLVDVGGHRLHIHCLGAGSPAVIFDSGLGGTSLDWTFVQAPIARTTRACAWDRAGMGWSDPGPMPRSPKQIAHELHALLQAAAIPGPYVLVAHSLGGKNLRLFAAEFPGEVAGMVLVDARNEYMDFHTSAADNAAFAKNLASQSSQYRLARIFGIARLFGPWLSGGPLPSETRRQLAVFSTREKTVDAIVAEGTARAADDVRLRDAPLLGNRPLIVLASGENMAQSADWRVSQRNQARLSSDARLIVARGSGHYIQWARPRLVIDSVREVVEKARRRAKHA